MEWMMVQRRHFHTPKSMPSSLTLYPKIHRKEKIEEKQAEQGGYTSLSIMLAKV